MRAIVLICLLVVVAGCDQIRKPSGEGAPPNGRYVLRSGERGVLGSVLLDTATGQSWMLVTMPKATELPGSPTLNDEPFVWLPIFRMPQAASKNSN